MISWSGEAPAPFIPGERVVLARTVFANGSYVQLGAIGTVTLAEDGTTLVRLDRPVPGLAEFDNELEWSPDDDASADLIPLHYQLRKSTDLRDGFARYVPVRMRGRTLTH